MTEKEVGVKEAELAKKEEKLKILEINLEGKRLKAENNYTELLEKKFMELRAPLVTLQEATSKKEAELWERENKIAEGERNIRYGLLKKIKEECADFREKKIKEIEDEIHELYEEFEKKKKQKNEGITHDLKEQIAHLESEQVALQTTAATTESKYDTLENETTNLQKQLTELFVQNKKYENLKISLQDKTPDFFIEKIANFEKDENQLKEDQEELRQNEREYVVKYKIYEKRVENLQERETNFEAEIDKKYPDRIESFEKEIEDAKDECSRLRSELRYTQRILAIFEDMKAQLGENPVEFITKYEVMTIELKEALDRIVALPSTLVAKDFEEIKKDKEELERRFTELQAKKEDIAEIKQKNAELKQEKSNLETENASLAKHNNFLQSEFDRLSASYEKPENELERITAINTPLFTTKKHNLSRLTEAQTAKTEKIWLENIHSQMKEFGLVFPKRILNAFHASLKIAEISPLTVLAGVSGTGKSELPRLYSHFGGINFLSLPVQPNWDCQEAMLGYYNSIDNYFDAQDVLRLLAQTQRVPENQNGLNDVMTLILLDEMNLANVELYFSDFLSKLETRRGCKDGAVPALGVKIGSKMIDWQLPLGRNVLWSGTMNQDETTKTLSDKVLDRGIVINFPAPKELESRKIIKKLDNSYPLLSSDIWFKWIKDGENISLKPEQIKGIKKQVEDINLELIKTGRALGHRVWQSIEAYILQYPDVIAAQDDAARDKAVKMAFEDQLVQKIMPKLRGIEVRGTQGKALDAIQKLIIDTNIGDDFENAKSQGYGQFMWCTSNYLLKDD